MYRCSRYQKSCRSYARKHILKIGGSFPRAKMTLERARIADSDSGGNSESDYIFFFLHSDVVKEKREFNPIDFSGIQDPAPVILVCRHV